MVCQVRDKARFDAGRYSRGQITVIEADFLKPETLHNIPRDIEAAYYLIHSMSATSGDFRDLEAESARNFREAIRNTGVRQVIYLGGIANNRKLSKHLSSRKRLRYRRPGYSHIQADAPGFRQGERAEAQNRYSAGNDTTVVIILALLYHLHIIQACQAPGRQHEN